MTTNDLLTVYRPCIEHDKHCAVFYLHGGGLVYGERDDLPLPYITMFTQAGYTLICADYPLAPESALPAIHDTVFTIWYEAVARPIQQGVYHRYMLFGRSAGAYLSLLLARRITQHHSTNPTSYPLPLGILDFYGYYDLCDDALRLPAAAYTSLPLVDKHVVTRITQPDSASLTQGSKDTRYALYVYARQHEDAWHTILGLDAHDTAHTPQAYSLTNEDIHALPPLFITASTTDEDIPYRISKTLWRTANSATIKTVYYLPHDFDRDLNQPDGTQVYSQAIHWMNQLLDSLSPRHIC